MTIDTAVSIVDTARMEDEDEVIAFIDSRIAEIDREIAAANARRDRFIDQRQKLAPGEDDGALRPRRVSTPSDGVPAVQPQWEILTATMSDLGPNRSFEDIRVAYGEARGKDVTSTTLRSQLSRMKSAGLVEGGNNCWSVKRETPEASQLPGFNEGADGQGSGLAPSIPAGSSPAASTSFPSDRKDGDGHGPATT